MTIAEQIMILNQDSIRQAKTGCLVTSHVIATQWYLRWKMLTLISFLKTFTHQN